MSILGLDIGGANVKAATDVAKAISVPFEIWRAPERLADELATIVEQFADVKLLAVTMTAELADCFATKAEGIDHVLRAVETIAGDRPIRVWQTAGEFVLPEVARQEPRLTAAANWHALATFVGRLVPSGSAVLLDIGSTTSDLIPIVNGLPMSTGRRDIERLQSGELVYTGVRRTPICAVTTHVPLGESECSVAAELFATTLDAYLLLGDIPEDAHDCETSNRRPCTKSAAHDRMARMLCCDLTELSNEDVRRIAEHVAATQLRRLCAAADLVVSRLSSDCGTVLISGSGAFLARRVAAQTPRLHSAQIVSLPELLGPRVSDAACAFAVAKLAAERELPFVP